MKPFLVAVLVLGSSLLVGEPASAASSNDDFQNRILIDALPFSHQASTEGNTVEEGEPTDSCGPIGATAWYAITPEADTALLISTDGSDFDTVLAVYRQETFGGGNLYPVACNDDSFGIQSEVIVHVSAGRTYYVQVGGYEGEEGHLAISVEEVVTPSNDSIGEAEAIASLPFEIQTSTRFATVEADEPAPSCAPIGATLWYRLSAEQDIDLIIKSLDSDYDTVLAVWRDDGDGLTEMACSDDARGLQSLTGFTTRAGETYYLQAGGFAGHFGELMLEVREGKWNETTLGGLATVIEAEDDEDRITKANAYAVAAFATATAHSDKKTGDHSLDACAFSLAADGCVEYWEEGGSRGAYVLAYAPFVFGLAYVERDMENGGGFVVACGVVMVGACVGTGTP